MRFILQHGGNVPNVVTANGVPIEATYTPYHIVVDLNITEETTIICGHYKWVLHPCKSCEYQEPPVVQPSFYDEV